MSVHLVHDRLSERLESLAGVLVLAIGALLPCEARAAAGHAPASDPPSVHGLEHARSDRSSSGGGAPVLAFLAAPGSAPRPALPGDAGAEAPPAGAAPPANALADDDSRPIIRLRVKNEFRPGDTTLAEIVEGRLITDLADMETFRTVGPEKPGTLLLTCTIRSLIVATADYNKPTRDAESSSSAPPTTQSRLTVSMDLECVLEDVSGKEIYRGKISADGGRDADTSIDSTIALARQDMIDRAAQRLERLLRKRLKKL